MLISSSRRRRLAIPHHYRQSDQIETAVNHDLVVVGVGGVQIALTIIRDTCNVIELARRLAIGAHLANETPTASVLHQAAIAGVGNGDKAAGDCNADRPIELRIADSLRSPRFDQAAL